MTIPRVLPRVTLAILCTFVLGLPAAPAQETPDPRGRALPLPPGAKRTAAEQQDTTSPKRRGILDLVDPKRKTQTPEKVAATRATAADVLRMTPGVGGDPLSGLSEDTSAPLSDDLRTLLAAVNRSGFAVDRADATEPPHAGTSFEMMSTLGLPSWTERPTRDSAGRITSMVDANGNRFTFNYGKAGFQGMKADARGPFNAEHHSGTLRQSEALGRFETRPLGLGNPNAIDRQFLDTRHSTKLPNSPFGGLTVSSLQPNGKRTFTTFDLTGRRAWEVDGNGGLNLNQYGPNGNLVGTYDSKGKLTLFGTNGFNRTGAYNGAGTRVLVTPGGSTWMRTDTGGLINSMGPYYGLQMTRGLQTIPAVQQVPQQPGLQQPWQPGQPIQPITPTQQPQR